jgi:hypothetical protein
MKIPLAFRMNPLWLAAERLRAQLPEYIRHRDDCERDSGIDPYDQERYRRQRKSKAANKPAS